MLRGCCLAVDGGTCNQLLHAILDGPDLRLNQGQRLSEQLRYLRGVHSLLQILLQLLYLFFIEFLLPDFLFLQ